MGDNKRRKVSYVRGVGIRRILREQFVSEDKDKKQISHNRKELRKFRIKGEEVEAYSKKDAIKRLKHKHKK